MVRQLSAKAERIICGTGVSPVHHRRDAGATQCKCGRWVLGLAMLSLGAGVARAGDEGLPASSMAEAGLKVAWQTQVPLGLTASIKSYYLVGGQIYAVASDGVVHAVRADNGDYLWARKLAAEFDVIFPPFMIRLPTTAAEQQGLAGGSHGSFGKMMEVVVFTRVLDVIALDPVSGQIVRRVALHASNNAAVAVSSQWIYQVSPMQRLNCLSIKDGFADWQLSTSAPLMLAPLYLPEEDAVYFVDEAGVLVGMKPSRERVMSVQLNAMPRGWLAVDRDAVYVATNDRYLHALDRKSGEVRWQYELAGRPEGGPVVIGDSIYQRLEKGGVQRVGNDPKRPDWVDAEALIVLAQWKEQAALLRPRGVLSLWNLKKGEVVRTVRAAAWADGGVNNPWNDAMIVSSKDGRLACVRPVHAGPLALAGFQPADRSPATRPTTRSSTATKPAPQAEAAPTVSTDQRLLTDPLRSDNRVAAP